MTLYIGIRYKPTALYIYNVRDPQKLVPFSPLMDHHFFAFNLFSFFLFIVFCFLFVCLFFLLINDKKKKCGAIDLTTLFLKLTLHTSLTNTSLSPSDTFWSREFSKFTEQWLFEYLPLRWVVYILLITLLRLHKSALTKHRFYPTLSKFFHLYYKGKKTKTNYLKSPSSFSCLTTTPTIGVIISLLIIVPRIK